MALFSKKQKLCNKNLINKVFYSGYSYYSSFIKARILPVIEEKRKVQVLFVVPKRLFKKATERNHIKRKLREAYRECIDNSFPLKASLYIAFLYQKKEITDFNTIQSEIKSLLLKAYDVSNKIQLQNS